MIDATTGAITRVGAPAVLTVDPSPDDHFIHVAIIRKPFSYVTTFERFGTTTSASWDRSGHTAAVLAKLPVADRVPVAGVPVGPRDFACVDRAGTLVWAEALDDGVTGNRSEPRQGDDVKRAVLGTATEPARTSSASRASTGRAAIDRVAPRIRRTATGPARS